MTTVAGTSYPQREALRALAHACRRAGGPVPLRKLLNGHLGRVRKLTDLGLVQYREGGFREHRDLMGRDKGYIENVYEPTEAGHALLAQTEGEAPPPPTPLREEHRAILEVLVEVGSPRTAGSIARRLDADLTARQVGARLSLLARHGFAESFEGAYMEPTKWTFTEAGQEAAR